MLVAGLAENRHGDETHDCKTENGETEKITCAADDHDQNIARRERLGEFLRICLTF